MNFKLPVMPAFPFVNDSSLPVYNVDSTNLLSDISCSVLIDGNVCDLQVPLHKASYSRNRWNV